MEKLLKLLNEFEERNDISTNLIIFSDGSNLLEEFWTGDTLHGFDTIKNLKKFLKRGVL